MCVLTIWHHHCVPGSVSAAAPQYCRAPPPRRWSKRSLPWAGGRGWTGSPVHGSRIWAVITLRSETRDTGQPQRNCNRCFIHHRMVWFITLKDTPTAVWVCGWAAPPSGRGCSSPSADPGCAWWPDDLGGTSSHTHPLKQTNNTLC